MTPGETIPGPQIEEAGIEARAGGPGADLEEGPWFTVGVEVPRSDRLPGLLVAAPGDLKAAAVPRSDVESFEGSLENGELLKSSFGPGGRSLNSCSSGGGKCFDGGLLGPS